MTKTKEQIISDQESIGNIQITCGEWFDITGHGVIHLEIEGEHLYFKPKPEDKRVFEDKYLNKLKLCAYARNVASLPNRTITEFSWFVNECIFGELKDSKFNPKDNEMEKWIDAFYEYCKVTYEVTEEELQQQAIKEAERQGLWNTTTGVSHSAGVSE